MNTVMQRVQHVIRTLMNNSLVYDLCQIVLEGDYHQVLTKTINARDDESILDIGCGTGYFSQFFNCSYTGVDLEPAYILSAQKNYKTDTKRFYLTHAETTGFPDKNFDKVLLINVIHHMDDDTLKIVLREAKRLARREVYIFDMTTDKHSFLTPLLLRLDNGKFMRTLDQQRTIISSIMNLTDSFTFLPPRKLLGHSAIVCSAGV